MPNTLDITMLFFVQVAITLAACYAMGRLLIRLGQPQVVADMVAGFVLGPTLLGAVLPRLQETLFPAVVVLPSGATVEHPTMTLISVTGHLGLVLYMFVVGLSFNGGLLRSHIRSAAGSSVAGILTPLVAGGLLGWLLSSDPAFFDSRIEAWQAALFVGASMAITAFPMLARIIHERGLGQSKVGTLALSCAAADDAAAWVLLAIIVATVSGQASIALLAVIGGLGYIVFMLTLGRRLLRRLDRTVDGASALPPATVTLVFTGLLVSAAYADYVGIYAVVGAFIFGAVMPRGALASGLSRAVEPIASRLLLPMFFVASGLKTELDLLLDMKILTIMLVVLTVAVVSKGLACTLGARATGLDWRSATSVGALMNARGLMELVLLDIGLKAGIVTPALYTVLAVMAIVTTFMATPAYNLIQRRWPPATDSPSGVTRPAVLPADR